jgi:hypothetical protein
MGLICSSSILKCSFLARGTRVQGLKQKQPKGVLIALAQFQTLDSCFAFDNRPEPQARQSFVTVKKRNLNPVLYFA